MGLLFQRGGLEGERGLGLCLNADMKVSNRRRELCLLIRRF